MQKVIPPFGLRLPVALKENLKAQAKANHRSMNSEIVAILERAVVAQREAA